MFSCYGGSVHQWDKVNLGIISSNGMGLVSISATVASSKACPLNVVQSIYCECLKDKCEWYLPESDQCSIPVIARKLEKL